MTEKKSKFGKYFVLTVSAVILFLCIRDIYVKNQISNNGKTIIAKFVSKERKPKTTNFYFTYFINNKKYTSANSGISYSIFNSEMETQTIDSLKLNSFYEAKYLPDNPNVIIVDATKEVKDNIEIKKASFE
jgi:hypothetical protein